MKKITSVCILLIGMISLTATASTSQLDQKQKVETVINTEITSTIDVIISIPGVVFMNQFTAEDSDAIDLAKKAIQSEIETGTNGVAKAVIKCHIPYGLHNGRDCVDVGGTMIQVNWFCPGDMVGDTGCAIAYIGLEEPNCRC